MSNKAYKVLWLAADALHPMNKGGRLRTFNVLAPLHAQLSQTYLTLAHDSDGSETTKAEPFCEKLSVFQALDQGATAIDKVWTLAKSLMNMTPYSVYRLRHPALKEAFEKELSTGTYRYVICDFVAAAANLPDKVDIPILLFQHNVEAQLWKRRSRSDRTLMFRVIAWTQYLLMRKFEGKIVRRVNGVICISLNDVIEHKNLYQAGNFYELPTSVDTKYFLPSTLVNPKNQRTVIFTGSIDYMPNQDGLKWFLKLVWPLLLKENIPLRLFLVGRNPPQWLIKLAASMNNVIVTGVVPDTRVYMDQSDLVIVPLLTGGGTRMKIYEAFSSKVPVVSTSIGAEGLPVENGVHISIADSPEDFAARVLELLLDDIKRAVVVDNAYQLVNTNFTAEAVASKFRQICEQATT